MARGINKVTLVGHLGQDPELRYMSNDEAVVNCSIATSESWKDKKTGENRERTEWHRVVIFGKLAEIVKEYAKKGSLVYIEGQLKTRKWADDSGVDRYITEVNLNSINGIFEILDNRQNKNHSNSEEDEQQKNIPGSEIPPASFEDDISF